MPEFNVIVENNGKIEYKNFFEFGQWNVIKKKLKELKNELIEIHHKNFRPTNNDIKKLEDNLKKFAEEHNIGHKFRFKGSLTCVNDFLEEKLKSECMYYFWAKCEWEVVIQGWPNDNVERKIDVYEQLTANWTIFRLMALNEI